MPNESVSNLKFEIGHVLFIDIIGYSKMLITEQSELLRRLTDVVRETEQFRSAEAEGMLVRLPTGDGMALVFRNTAEAPVQCALELSKALKAHPELSVRMGIHSGPVNEVADVNERTNITGAGINMAQRVMDCGDAGHILLSKHVADDLEQYPQWRSHLHELGECEVKHSVRVHVVNLYTEELGNPEVPEKFKQQRGSKKTTTATGASAGRPAVMRWAAIAGVVLLLAGIGFWIFRAKSSVTARGNGVVASSQLAPAIPDKSIAVLPFENLSSDKENAYFTDGVQDEILANLAKVADLKVISRTSVMLYKSGNPRNLREIGQQLGVAHVVEGSVQRASNRVRVTAQLIDARTDAHLWANTYDRDLADVFAIQSEIAKVIADQLQAKLSPREKAAIERPPTIDLVAFDLYNQARPLPLGHAFGSRIKDKLLEAIELLEQAIARDPAFLLAYCRLAGAHAQLYFLNLDHTPARLASANAAVQTALGLRPDAGEAHLALAELLYRGYLSYDHARAEIGIAQRTLPNEPLIFELTGYIDRREGHWQESIRNMERAIELDPRNFFTLQQISLSYRSLRRYPEMASALDRALEIVPKDAETRVGRAMVDFDWRADPRPLHRAIELIRAESARAIQDIAATWFVCALAEHDGAAAANALVALGENDFGSSAVRLSHAFGEGLRARMTNDEGKASSAFTVARAQQEKIVQAQPDYGPALCVLGLIDAALGRKEEALREGRRAVELMPLEKDSVNGAEMVAFFAIITAWLNEKDLACDQLTIATRLPGSLSYGQLKLLPYWDPLRGDQRFEKIVADLAPKTADK